MAPTQRPMQGLEIRQGQSLVMTPQLQQALKLLQYSSQELQAYIDEQLEKNPLLAKEGQEDVREEGEEQAALELSDGIESEETQDIVSQSEQGGSSEDEALDISHENRWEEGQDFGQGNNSLVYEHTRSGNHNFDSNEFDLEQMEGEKPSLRDSLLDQIYLDIPEPQERIIATHLMDGLDAAGYLSAPLSEFAQQLGVPLAQVEKVLEKLHRFDPPGIFARDLKECLALQLREKNRLDPAMQLLLDNLPLLATGDMPKLEKICHVNHEDMVQMCAEIRALNPKPGSDFDYQQVETMRPDVFVKRGKDGSWQLELNNETLPRMLVNRRYYAQVKQHAKGETEKKYLSDQLGDANWLVKTLNQRAETILKVATELVQTQQDFFEKGVAYLKPLTLKIIADKIGVHESTVGRVTTSKYMATPQGVFEMKFFFSSSVTSIETGEDVSSTAVKHLIKQLIDKENIKDVLSDDTLVDMLQERGISVARRTVAKYREAMHIPSSVERRRLKKMQGS